MPATNLASNDAVNSSLDRLEQLSLQTKSWFWETDAEHTFTYFSKSIEQLTDMRIADLVGTSRLQLALSRKEEHWQEHARLLQSHQPFENFRYVRETPTGSLNLVVSGWPYFDDDGKFAGYRGSARDETENVKEQRRALLLNSHLRSEAANSRRNLETLLENLSQSVIWYEKDGSFKHVNAITSQMLGFEEQQYAGVANIREHLRLLAERGDFGDCDIAQEVETRFARLTDVPEFVRYRIDMPSIGRSFQVERIPLSDGTIIMTHVDVTAEVEANRKIADRDKSLKAVLDTIDYGIVLLEPDLSVAFANKAFAAPIGVSQEYMASKPDFEDVFEIMREKKVFNFPEWSEETWKKYVAARRKQISSGDSDPVERQLRNGRFIIETIFGLEDGRRMVTFTDITEHKKREEKLEQLSQKLVLANEELEERVVERTKELREAQAQLVENERQALLNDLVSSMCHELRNPLNALNTSLYIVRNKVEPDFPKLSRAFDRSERTIQRCKHILDDLYAYALTEEIKTSPTDAHTWLKETITGIDIDENVELDLDISGDSPICQIDDSQLAMALRKIVANAALATQEVEKPDYHGRVQVLARTTKTKYFEILVIDNGCGMDAAHIKKAMEPLFSTRGFGVGLGLPIADQVLQRHNGELRVDSTPGEGTTVTMALRCEH